MADRTVSVNLVANAQAYIRDVQAAAAATTSASQTIEQRLAAQRQAFVTVGTAATAFGALTLAGVGLAISKFADFDQAMSNVQAATHESAENMELLRDAALEAGASTVFSATESAAAIEELSKAGISTADILNGGLNGALSLAAAGQIEVGDAAEIAASAMTQFGLAGTDVTHIADLLAAGAGKAQGGVTDLSGALNQSGLVASQMGLSLEETVGSLSAFASAGLIGSDAGTSFRSMLLRLSNPTGEAAQLMDDLGLSFYDAQGEFIGMEGVAGQLQERLVGLTDEQRNAALATIFGQDAIRAASILYTEGADGIAEWTAAVDDQGYAAETAATRLDNLKGDLEALGGAFETLLIGFGEGGEGPLRDLVQTLTDVVEWFNQLPAPVQQTITILTTLVGAVALVGGTALVVIPQIAEFKVALTTLGITAASTRGALSATAGFLTGPWGIAIAGVVTGMLILNEVFEASKPTTAEWEAALRSGADAADIFALANQGVFEGFEVANENFANFLDDFNRINENSWATFDFSTWDLQTSNFASSIREVDEALSAMDLETIQANFQGITEEYDLNRDSQLALLEAMPGVRDALIEQADATGVLITNTDGTIDSQALLAFAMGETEVAAADASEGLTEVADATQEAADAAYELIDAQQQINDLFFGAQDAVSAYEQSIDDVTAAINEGLAPALTDGGNAFDLTEQSGRDAAAMMQELVTNANAATTAMIENGASAEEVAAFQAQASAEIEATGLAMGASESLAESYSNMLLNVPESVITDIQANTATAQGNVDKFIRNNNGRVVSIVVQTSNVARATPGGAVTAYAGGGRIPGYAPGYDDRLGFDQHGNVYGLGGGEFIMPTLQTERYLRQLEEMRAGRYPTYADGGRLGRSITNYATNAVYGGDTFAVNITSAGETKTEDITLAMTYLRHMSRGGRGGGR